MTPRSILRHERGVSLIELIVFIIIVSVAMLGVLMVLNLTASKSADPMLRKQALALAEATMEEVLAKSYQNDPSDPNNTSDSLGCTVNTPPTCAVAGCTTPTVLQSCRHDEPLDRPRYNDVDDYDGWDLHGAYQQDGGLAPVVGDYQVVIHVVPFTLNGVTNAKQVTVTVTGGSEPITLVGYRTLYEND